MAEQLRDMIDDICVISNYAIFTAYDGAVYSVTVRNEADGTEMASASELEFYDALRACWQALCG